MIFAAKLCLLLIAASATQNQITNVMVDICLVSGCGQFNYQYLEGKPFCIDHYREKFMEVFMNEYEGWQVGAEPSKRMKYMLGRFQGELCFCSGGSYLSTARVRDRGFNFRKTEGGGEFSITRHLNAWNYKKKMKRVVESWRFEIEKYEFTLTKTRRWTKDDPD